jgi:acyl-ACP thioesterase
MEKIGLYQYYFRPGQFDFKSRIAFSSLIGSILDAAGKHAEANNFGIEDLMKGGKTWILSRLLFEFLAEQPNTHNILVETWIDKIEDVFTSRRFNVYGGENKIFASASTKWAMIDIHSRRFLSLKKYLDEDFVVNGRELLCGEPSKISIDESNWEFVRKIETLYSDIDINKHVTSTRYIQWILDVFSLEYHQSYCIRKFEINFLSEVLYGDIIRINKQECCEKEFIVELIKESDNKIACVSRILWE